MIASYRDLTVWQRAMDLVVLCYECAEQFPRTEQYGLRSQVQRAAVSVVANIAEGHGRTSTREYLHFLSVSYGSLMELETLLHVAERIHYMAQPARDRILATSSEVGKMLNGLMASLNRRLTEA